MNWPHPFAASLITPTKCQVCKRNEIDHTERATCEVCGNSGTMELRPNDILMCDSCVKKEPSPQDVLFDHPTPEEVQRRFKTIDERIAISTDLFNAETVAINTLREAIDADDTIPADQKHFALARAVSARHEHYSNIIFDQKQETLALENKQRAVQVYYNELAKKLRDDQRAQIRLKDATYVVREPAKISKPRAVTVKKFDRAEVKHLAAKHGLPEQTITILCVQKGMTAQQAVDKLLASLAD